MQTIALTQGKTACVSDEDFERLSKFKWWAAKSGGRFEARAKISGRDVKMHNVVMGAVGIDHKDGDGLNNQRENLRIANRSQNGQNRKPQKHSSRYKGVSFWARQGKFAVSIMVNKRRMFLGYFEDELDGAKAYDAAAIAYFGEFARPNFKEVPLAI